MSDKINIWFEEHVIRIIVMKAMILRTNSCFIRSDKMVFEWNTTVSMISEHFIWTAIKRWNFNQLLAKVYILL